MSKCWDWQATGCGETCCCYECEKAAHCSNACKMDKFECGEIHKEDEIMAKERKCKMTEDQQAIHREAVRLRKMTDEQLVAEFSKARTASKVVRTSEKVDNAPQGTNDKGVIKKLLHELAEGKCKGIKGATVHKLTEFARELGML